MTPSDVSTLIGLVNEVGACVAIIDKKLTTHIEVQDANALVREQTCPHLSEIQQAKIDVDAVASTMRRHSQDSETYKQATERTIEALTTQIKALTDAVNSVKAWFRGGRWVAGVFLVIGGFAVGRLDAIASVLHILGIIH